MNTKGRKDSYRVTVIGYSKNASNVPSVPLLCRLFSMTQCLTSHVLNVCVSPWKGAPATLCLLSSLFLNSSAVSAPPPPPLTIAKKVRGDLKKLLGIDITVVYYWLENMKNQWSA